MLFATNNDTYNVYMPYTRKPVYRLHISLSVQT